MHTFEVDLNDVIKVYDLKKDEGFLYCLYEAISNSLYCCRDNKKVNITVQLYRQYKANELAKDEDHFIDSFVITDNGTGFTDDNYANFTKTIYKTNHAGGKGIGRIAFLKVFTEVEINSAFARDGQVFRRKFNFNHEKIKDFVEDMPVDTPLLTELTFKEIKTNFQLHTKKSANYYSDEVLRHFYAFFYYLIGKDTEFEIRIIDDNGTAEGIINADKLKQDKVLEEKFQIKNVDALPGMDTVDFELIHIKTKNINSNEAFYVVDERSAGAVNNLDLPPSILEDENGDKFYYCAYLKSDYFTRYLNESRTELSLPNKGQSVYVTVEKIEQEVKERIYNFLRYEIDLLNGKKVQKVQQVLIDQENNIIAHNKAYLYMLSDDSTQKVLLEKIQYKDSAPTILTKVRAFHEDLQRETVNKINNTIEKLKNNQSDIDFTKLESEIGTLIERVNTENLINLSSYIMYRKYILNLFNEGLQCSLKSAAQNEAFFHHVLLPKKISNSIDSNLWLLDDLFLYFEGISEVAIEDIVINGSKIIRDLTVEEKQQLDEFNQKRLRKRIDLLFFPAEKKCIIIELKDPKAGLNDNVLQMDRYAQLIANFVKPEFSI
ncbi:MAG: hypothetical protein LBT84_08120, partial [Spirochaetia bacterium]|nr:hypothetical protein [Spirochaetia bacterium]